AMDWAIMLLRMYERFGEIKKWKVTLVDETKGEEAGIKSATIQVEGSFAYGLLKKESGTHRLVRLSPFNADNLRQTSFALVEVLPVIDSPTAVDLKDSDLEWDTFRSSGPGGQNVQKVSTAVRVKHLPTGIVVAMQSERSQFQNKENALKILKAKLFQIEEEKRLSVEKNLKDWQKTASWGTQIRSYVLHPYKMVKDLRSNYETSDAEGVLDGKLDELVEAELRI
ncbi:MAG TPA: peptide chain release factor-like protein, partial [Candidatus Saccharimonadales bacterium]|nr:peptide chain release factor-like protein [Candidatus Saccharimonadales bacterium]